MLAKKMCENDFKRIVPNHILPYVLSVKDHPLVPKFSNYAEILTCNSKNQYVMVTISTDSFKDHSIIWYFDEDSPIHATKQPTTNMHIFNQLSFGAFLKNNDSQLIFGGENGEISLVELVKSVTKETHFYSFSLLNNEIAHLSAILNIAQFENGTFLTIASDSIKIWSYNEDQEFCEINAYRLENDYYEFVSADVSKSDSNLFAATTTQKNCLLYDIRERDSVSNLFSHEFSVFEQCVFDEIDNHKLYLGTRRGTVYLLDVRNPGEFLESVEMSERSPIVKIVSNANRSLAVASSRSTVSIFDCRNDKFQTLYTRTDLPLVRDLCWNSNNNFLYSCHWQSPVILHSSHN